LGLALPVRRAGPRIERVFWGGLAGLTLAALLLLPFEAWSARRRGYAVDLLRFWWW
jgi:hypothetical protein